MIELKNVSFSYGSNQVLKNFSIKINDGDRICLYGDSGIGKTTIIRLILGLEKADKNSVVCTDKKISVVFQEDRLLPFKTVQDNISMFANTDRNDYMLSSLGIFQSKDKYPSELSGGMLRRAAIARALSVDADVYIFDEPFTGLDNNNINCAISLINEITENKTLITVLHNKENAVDLKCNIIEIADLCRTD